MLKKLGRRRYSAARALVQALARLGIDLQNKVRPHKFGRHSPELRERLFEKVSVQLADNKGAVGTTASTNINGTVLGCGIGGPRDLRTSLRQLKERFASPIGPKSMKDQRHNRHVDLPSRIPMSTFHDMAPVVGRNIKQALRGTLSR